MIYCHGNVILAVWKQSRQLLTSRTPSSIREHEEGTGEIGSDRGGETSLTVRSHSDSEIRHSRRFRSARTGNEHEMQSRSPGADTFSTVIRLLNLILRQNEALGQ